YHFFTQPLPTLLGYYAHQLPGSIKAVMTFLMFIIELGIPFLIFIPRLRGYVFLILAGFQLAVAATGTSGFFNLLTIVLFVPLLPDAWVRRVLPRRMLALVPLRRQWARGRGVYIGVQVALFAILCELALTQTVLMFTRPAALPKPMLYVLRKAAPFE